MTIIMATKKATSLIGGFLTRNIRDFFYFPGLVMLGYGLYLYRPWIAFSVCGVLLMITGYLMRDEV